MLKNNKHLHYLLINIYLFAYFGLILLVPFVCSITYAASLGKPQSFTFLTWSEYIDPEIIHEFEQKFNAKINFYHYETDDTRDSIMAETNGQGFDLILISGLMLNQYVKLGWLDPIDYAQLKNLKHIHKRWISTKKTEQFQIPYFWGSLGIAYRQDLIQQRITSWRQLLAPDESLKGKILMIKNSREMTAVALKSLGYSGNSADLEKIKEASSLLRAQKPYVQGYSYLTISAKSPLITGKLIASMTYSGDALFLKNQHPDIVYVLPDEGSILWMDYLSIGRGSRKKDLVLKFIDFINQPEIAARNAKFVYYATPNQSAERFLTADFLNNPVIYPSPEDMKKMESLSPLPTNAQRLLNSIMLDLTHH